MDTYFDCLSLWKFPRYNFWVDSILALNDGGLNGRQNRIFQSTTVISEEHQVLEK